jgi:hypothetical protein
MMNLQSNENASEPMNPLEQLVMQARGEAERGDFSSAIATQERAVALARQQGNSEETLTTLSALLFGLTQFYGASDRFADATRAMEEVVAIDERTSHEDLESDRQMLENVRRLSTMTPEELKEVKASAAQHQQEQDQVDENTEMEAYLASLPPEERTKVEAAMREFQQLPPDQQAAVVEQAKRAQIQQLADQVRDAAIAARQGKLPKDQLVPQLENLVAQIEKQEGTKEPWGDFLGYVRGVVSLLRGTASLLIVPGRDVTIKVPPAYAAHFAAVQQTLIK